MKSTIERFEEKIYYGLDGCWYWTACVTDQGYGRFGYKGRNALAPRVSYELFVGNIQDGMCVLHRCDNPTCVNPDHLFVGTNYDNVIDKVRKGRAKGLKGQNSPTSILTDQDILIIREMKANGFRVRDIAYLFPVTESNIGHIIKGRAWKHI